MQLWLQTLSPPPHTCILSVTHWPRKKIKKQHKVKEVMAVSIVIIIYYTDYIGLIHSVGLDFDLSILMSWWL